MGERHLDPVDVDGAALVRVTNRLYALPLQPLGELDLCHTPDSLQVEREKSLLNRALGVRTDILSVDEVLEGFPLVDVTGGGELPVVGASYHPPGAFARHDSVVWGYAAAAERRGVHVHQGVTVTGVMRHGGAVVGVGEAGVWVRVCGPSGPPGPSGSTTVVVGVGDVGLVVVSSGDVVVSVVVVVGVVVVVTASLGRRTFVRGTQV